MKTINVIKQTRTNKDSPLHLECVASIEDIQILRKMHSKVVLIEGIKSYSTRMLLYAPPLNGEWNSRLEGLDIIIDRTEPTKIYARQSMHRDITFGDHILSHQIDINKLEKYLKRNTKSIPTPSDWDLR